MRKKKGRFFKTVFVVKEYEFFKILIVFILRNFFTFWLFPYFF